MSGRKRTVLVSMDGSEHSDHALEWYITNFHNEDDQVILIHCPEFANVKSPLDASAMSELLKKEERRVRDFLQELGEKLKKYGAGGKVKSIGGEPGKMIINTAKEENADLIVTGSRGHGKLRRTILGSVSDYVLHHSPVPVLVCKYKEP